MYGYFVKGVDCDIGIWVENLLVGVILCDCIKVGY